LTSLSGIQNVTAIGFDAELVGMIYGDGYSVDFFGGVHIAKNEKLDDLSGLQSLTSISGSLIIRDTKVLNSLAPLKNITAIDNDVTIDISSIQSDNDHCPTRNDYPSLSEKLSVHCEKYIGKAQ